MSTHKTEAVVILLFAFALVLCGTAPLLAQRKGGGLRGGGADLGPGSIVPMEYDNAPFDLTRGWLPRAYGGHNIQVVYKSFENGAAKMLRGDGAGRDMGTMPLSWMDKADSVYAFHVKPSEVRYEKREEKIRVSCQLWSVLGQGTPEREKSGFRIAYVPQVDHSYTYTGPDGRNIEIEEVKFREYTVAFGNIDSFPVERHPEQAKGSPLSLDDSLRAGAVVARSAATKEQADQLERNIRLLVLCRLVEPFVTSETVNVKGTPEKPGEYLAQHEYLHVRLLELWLYDAYSGKVLQKIGPDNDKNRPDLPLP